MTNFPFINPVDTLQQRAAEDPARLSHMLLGANEAENQSLTYSQLDAAVKEMAAHLQHIAEPGQRALLVYPTGLEFIIAMYACLYAGIVPIPTNPPGANRSAQRLDAIARDARASLVLTTPEFESAFTSSADSFPDFAALRWVTRDSLLASPKRAWLPTHPRPEDVAFMQYTSGSTNLPKGVIISHRNFSHQMHALHASRALEYSRDDSAILSWTPLFHDMGLLVGIFLTVVDHTPGIMMSPIAFMQQPLSWLKAIQKYRVTASGGPNFAYELCANKIPVEKCEGLDLSTWKLAYNSAEPVRAETQTKFAEKFAPFGFKPQAFHPCYGMAESTLVITVYGGAEKTIAYRVRRADFEEGKLIPADSDNPKDFVETISSGLPLVDFQVKIVNPNSRQACAIDQVGEVWVKGDSVGEGYWNRPEETAHTFGAQIEGTGEGPFLRTGDMGFLHEGHLYITGRLKDLLIVRGRNYYPQDIEMTVEKSHTGLRAGGGAAFAVNANGMEGLVAVQEVQRREMAGVDWNEVIKTIRANVAREHGIRAYAVVLIRKTSIPKTSSGKIQRSEAHRQFIANELDIIAEWRAPG